MSKRFFGRKIEVQDAESSQVQAEEQGCEDSSCEMGENEGVERVNGEVPGSEESAGELQQRVSEVSVLHKLLEESRDKHLRAVAELENGKKRHAKERSDLIRYAGEGLAADILDIADDLDRALASGSSSSAASDQPQVSAQDILQGVSLIRNRLLQVLERHGIRPVESLGEKFDPKQHEALASVPTAEREPGVVLEQFRKAYLFKDKLLRTAQVVVSAASESTTAVEESAQEARSSIED